MHTTITLKCELQSQTVALFLASRLSLLKARDQKEEDRGAVYCENVIIQTTNPCSFQHTSTVTGYIQSINS